MEKTSFEYTNENSDSYIAEYKNRSLSYPEICSEFLTILTKSIKSAALYTLSHPLVIESLRRDYALLNMIFEGKEKKSFTLSFVDDAWLFNDTIVPAVTLESRNLNSFFKTHGIHNLLFLKETQFFELGVLAEFLSTSSKNQPKGYFEKFLKEKGVNNIRAEEIHYEKRFEHRDSSYESTSAAMFQDSQKPVQDKTIKQAARRITKEESVFPSEIKSKNTTQPTGITPETKIVQGSSSPLQVRTTASAIKSRPAAQTKVSGGFAATKPIPASKNESFGGAAGAKTMSSSQAGTLTGAAGTKPISSPGKESLKSISNNLSQQAPEQQREKTIPEIKSTPASQPGTEQKEKDEENVLTSLNFGISLSRIIESAVKTPEERVHVYKDVLNLIRKNVKQEVDKKTEVLIEEKNRILNTRNRTEKVLSKVAEGKVILDKDGNILMMNPAAEEISGKKFSDVVGKHISEHVKPGEHFLAISKDMDITGGNTISGEVDVVGDIHVERTMRHSMALLEDDEGRVVGAYTTLPEITKFKETQRMQEEFLSRVTHDLQTPLSSVSSALEMLIESSSEKLDPVERKFLDISIRNSLRLNKMIKGILDFSKLQSGKIDMHPQPSSISDMLKEAGDGLLPWAERRNLNIIVRLPSPDIYVMADHQRIVQVLTNLISNAVKSTPEGGTITVAASPAPNNERNVIIGVRDTGRGIAKENLKKIFDKFVQLDNSKGPSEGVGLGLSIVNEFVSLHDGKVWANSEVGKGSTFYFTLPMPE
jgi:PAS domain S-box-containing protein